MASLTDLDEALPDLIDAPAPVPTPTSNSDSDDESDYDEKNTQDSPSAEERVLKALSMKEEGNTYFKSSDYDKAARAYRRGVSGIKSLNLSNTGDEQVKSLLLTLNNNLAMVYSKLEKWSMVRSVTTNALAVDSTSVKALYRRGMAHKNLKNMEKVSESESGELNTPNRTAPHRTAPHRTAPHRTTPHRTAPHRTAPQHY